MPDFVCEHLIGKLTPRFDYCLIMYKITTEYIKLDSFLKSTSVASTGGTAKLMIAGGEVLVNGEVELRRGRKLFPGDRVSVLEHDFVVEQAE